MHESDLDDARWRDNVSDEVQDWIDGGFKIPLDGHVTLTYPISGVPRIRVLIFEHTDLNMRF